jgi:hypothetical protein
VKIKKGFFLLFTLAVVLCTGLSLWERWEQNKRVHTALPAATDIVLDKSEKFFLYSLQGECLPATDMKTMHNFHGYPILGQTRVRVTPQRADLLAALRKGLGKKSAATCFNPHHGIRAVRGTQTVDLIISFGSEQMEIYDNRGMHQISVSAPGQGVFNRVLSDADVPLPEPPSL